MRYSKTHKQETREKLLQSSRVVAKRNGFGTTGVDALMAAVGLTGGAFYSHFDSKEDLFASIIELEMEQSARMLAGDEGSQPDHIAQLLKIYLSTYHATHPGEGCALPALGPEIARSSPEIRTRVERAVKHVHSRWTDRLGGDKDAAWAFVAQCVGSILIARVVESEQTQQEILSSSRRFMLQSSPHLKDAK
ncbi:TetR/AcrR family transcriptional regulator [Janthinobacterium agaricidamnosum]|uniref:TetR/AcrR family transcriptional regulator n=1 Tax=Janthinobacterium agaricidamnosum TaxID=55508 RepID=UPI0005714B0D|nr:TetR/AcrR family transcriptional regulator [Janthinobacterium agaricidamnosum]